MKRILSLILALVIVLGTMPLAFAADNGMTAGENLKANNFIAGGANGDLMEGQKLTRAQLAVLIAQLNGLAEEAKNYKEPSMSTDVKEGDWFKSYVAYAQMKGWMKGVTDKEFDPNGLVSERQLATVMLVVLGYEPVWETAIEQAKAIGLEVGAKEAASMTRGEAFETMWSTVNTPKKGSDIALGVELEKIEAEEEASVEMEAVAYEVKAIAANQVEVKFEKAVAKAAAENKNAYLIVDKKDSSKEVAIESAMAETDTIVVIETEELKAGRPYKMTIADMTVDFSGIAKDSEKPKVDSVKGKDTGEVEIEFEDALLDRASAENVDNYEINKGASVIKAVLNDDRDKVTLTVDGIDKASSRKLTIMNIVSTDGVMMKKVTKPFGAKVDKIAPKLDKVWSSDCNDEHVIIDWTDNHGVDKETAENVENYSIDGLEILEAKAIFQNSDKNDEYYDRVVLTTTPQKKSKSYTLKVLHMVDGSTSHNATKKVLDEKFRGGTADNKEPEVKGSNAVSYKNLTTVHVEFTEENSLSDTALDPSNYTFKDDALEVLEVKFEDPEDNGNTYDLDKTGLGKNKDNDKITVVLTVSEMEENKYYRLRINNIADNYGNTMEKKVEKSFKIPKNGEVKTFARIDEIETNDLEKVVVYFTDEVTKATAENPTNYTIDGYGTIKKAERKKSARTKDKDLYTKVILTVPKMDENTTYELEVNNVENYWGYACENVKKKFTSMKDGIDTERPEVEAVEYVNNGELRITFSEKMKVGAGSVVTIGEEDTLNSTTGVYANTINLPYVDKLENDTVLVFDARFAADVTAAGAGGPIPNAKINEVYDIVSFSGTITDEGMNAVDYTSADEEFTTSEDTVIPNDDRVSNDSLSQENGNVIHATFDREVKELPSGATIIANINEKDGKASSGNFTFNAKSDDDDASLVILTAKSPSRFDEKSWELQFDFSEIYGSYQIVDLLGRALKDEDVNNDRDKDDPLTIDVDNDDEIGPSVVEVRVIDKRTIEIEFDEKLINSGSYKLIDVDDDNKPVGIATTTLKDKDTTGNVVELKLSKDLTVDDSYELSYGNSKPKDLSGNKVDQEDETFEFEGTDLAPNKTNVFAKVYSATAITFTSEDGDFVNNDTITVTGTNAPGYSFTVPAANNSDEVSLQAKKYYSFLSKNAAGKDVEYKITVGNAAFKKEHIFQPFTGLLEEDNVTITSAAGTASIVDTGSMTYDSANYNYQIIDSTDAIVGTNAQISGDTNGDFKVNAAVRGTALKLIGIAKGNNVIEFITEAFSL